MTFHTANKGDVIYVKRRLSTPEVNLVQDSTGRSPVTANLSSFRHYGIYIGNYEVVHFAGDDDIILGNIYIKRTNMEGFLKGSSCFYVDDMVRLEFDPDEVVERALSQVGTDFGGYHFFKNNCEHFTYWCATGKRSSRQVFFMNDDQDIVEKAIDNAFEPLVRLGAMIDKLFGWG